MYRLERRTVFRREAPPSANDAPQTRQKKIAASTGRKHTEETKAKISAGNKGKVFSEETRAKIGASRVGKPTIFWNEEQREEIRQRFLGKKLPPEQMANMSKTMLALRAVKPAVFLKQGTGEYKGVVKRGNRWRARVRFQGKDINLGQFATSEEAARAFDDGARKYLGKFALLNFPLDGERSALTGEIIGAATA